MFYNILSPYLRGDGTVNISRLRNLREDHDLKQKDIAGLLNCSQVAYSYYEIGRREIPLALLCRLADYYHTSVDYLLGRTDNPVPYEPSRYPANK